MTANKNEIKRICIYGMGGVGGSFGGRMAHILNQTDSQFEIYFVARGEHLQKIRDGGLLLKSTQLGNVVCRPKLAVDDLSELPQMDLILLCVKGYDLDQATEWIARYSNDNTLIIPLLNGVAIDQRIRNIVHKGVVLPGCVYVGGYIEKPGIVVHSGGDLLIFGLEPCHSAIPEWIFELFNVTGINYKCFDNPYPAIWEKFIFIAAFGLVTAFADRTIGEVMADEQLCRYVKEIMSEIHLIAKAEKVELKDSIVEESLIKGKKFPYELKTSLQRDIEQRKKRNELEILGGSIIRLGEKHGIPTPVTETLYQYLENIINSPKPDYF